MISAKPVFLRFNSMLLLSLALLMMFFCGCGKPDSGPGSHTPAAAEELPAIYTTNLQMAIYRLRQIPRGPQFTNRTPELSQPAADRREWMIGITRTGYAKSGHSKPQWNTAMEAVFGAYADYTRKQASRENYSLLTNAISAASAGGCTDPFLGYLKARYGLLPGLATTEDYALAYSVAFYGMVRSSYHPALKFMAGFRTCDTARNVRPKPDLMPVIEYTSRALEDLILDTNAPADEIFEPVTWWTDSSYGTNWHAYLDKRIVPLLEQNWGRQEACYRFLGKIEIERAWLARGGGFANTVKDEAWPLFEKHLASAQSALETSWSLNSSNAETAYLMMRVELGQGQGKPRMERWFQRTMALDPNHSQAANLMAFYLEPRWHGSAGEALKFARSCVTSTKWGGEVPLVLPNCHRSLASYAKLADSPEYWSKPGVWEDVRSGYEKFFKLNPGAAGYRHDYARDAYACQKYAEFLSQVKLFTSTNLAFFGGQEKFEQMLKLASSKQ